MTLEMSDDYYDRRSGKVHQKRLILMENRLSKIPEATQDPTGGKSGAGPRRHRGKWGPGLRDSLQPAGIVGDLLKVRRI